MKLTNVAKLFVIIVGTVIGVSLGAVGLHKAAIEITKIRYEAAEMATYAYIQGDPLCDIMTGPVDLMIQRGYTIQKVPLQGSDIDPNRIPLMMFFDANGEEIVKSRMEGRGWCLGDMKVRFGVELDE